MLNPYSSLTIQKTCYIIGSPDHLKKQCKIKPSPNSTKKEICNMWNNLSNSPCHLSNGRCKYNCLRQCKQCKKQGCKAVLHTPASQLSPSNLSDGTVKNSAYSPSKQTPVQAHPAQQQQAQQQHEQQPEKHHKTSTLPSEYVAVPSQLKQRHIMWCKVQSSNLTLNMPLDSCCSVSLCSLDHAKRI